MAIGSVVEVAIGSVVEVAVGSVVEVAIGSVVEVAIGSVVEVAIDSLSVAAGEQAVIQMSINDPKRTSTEWFVFLGVNKFFFSWIFVESLGFFEVLGK